MNTDKTTQNGEFLQLDPETINFSETNKIFRDASEFTPNSLKELAASIAENGLAQPILVRRTVKGSNSRFLLVAGERRLRAWLMNFPGKGAKIPAYVRDLDDQQALELQIIENCQRENIGPMLEAKGFQHLITKEKMTTTMIATRIGKSIDYVQERLRLTNLTGELQNMVKLGDLPLKAALKFAMIPMEQQEDAYEETTETIDLNVPGKSRVIFRGLETLQTWMDGHLFIELKTADFDKEDPKLNPAMGPCSTCVFRTRNTGGLFDDITLVDECTKALCFRTKQSNHYIIFKKRSNSIEGMEIYKKLVVGEIKGAGAGKVCSEKEGSTRKDAELAILVGVGRNGYDTFKNTQTHVWIKPNVMNAGTRAVAHSDGKPAKAEDPDKVKAEEQKRKDERIKNAFKESAEYLLEVEAVRKKYSPKLMRSAFSFAIIEHLENGDQMETLSVLKALGIDWYQDVKNKNTLIKAKDADLAMMEQSEDYDGYPTDKQMMATLAPLSDKQIQELFFVAAVRGDYQMRNLVKPDAKGIAKKANSQMQSWWAKILEQRKAAEVKPKNLQSNKAVGKLINKLLASGNKVVVNPAKKKKGGKR